jgi:hypothetical protein
MSLSELMRLTPDAARFGENVARTIRIIAKLLADWSEAERQRRSQRLAAKRSRQVPSQPVPSQEMATQPHVEIPFLRAIYFDKLATCFCRLWDELCERGHVRYQAAVLQEQGFHGPGRALMISRKEDDLRGLGKRTGDYRRSRFAFTTEIVEKLKPSVGNARILFRLEGQPWHAKCRVYPQLEPSQWAAWMTDIKSADDGSAFLSGKEVESLATISSALASLSAEQIRALGTHSSATATCSDIEFNLRTWWRCFDRIISHLGGKGARPSRAAYKLVTTSREIVNKTIKNRREYRSARKKVLDRLTDPHVRDAFSSVHAEDTGIWDHPDVRVYGSLAPILLAASTYCRRGLYELGAISGLTREERLESEECLACLQSWGATQGVCMLSYEQIKSQNPVEWAGKLVDMGRRIRRGLPRSQDE